MLTYKLWSDFEYSCEQRYVGFAENKHYKYDNNEIATMFVLSMILTPVSVLVDLIALPFEFIYLIALKVANKLRKEDRK